MAARKSKRSRSVTVDRRRFGLSRPSRVRRTLPVVVVVCDDARTAVAYFSELRRKLKESVTLTVERNPSDRAGPVDVVNTAKAQLILLRERNSKDRNDVSSVWALVDLEASPSRRNEGKAAKRDGKKHGVEVALSDPCYEVWTLMHLEDTGATFANCKAVLARVRQKWQARFGEDFGKKAQVDYAKIIGDRMTAVSRARTHHTRSDPSWTEVYLLIEEIERRCSAPLTAN